MSIDKIILAMPNSASESLMHLINNNSNYSCEQIFTFQPDYLTNVKSSLNGIEIFKRIKILLTEVRNKLFYDYNQGQPFRITNPASGFECLSNFHGDICNFDRALFEKFSIHLKNNENLILKQHIPPTLTNKIFLKDTKKIILIRDPQEIINKYKNSPLLKDNEFKKLLIYELNNWCDHWSNEENSLVISKNDLVENTLNTIKKIQKHTGILISIDKKYVLPHINKTRI